MAKSLVTSAPLNLNTLENVNAWVDKVHTSILASGCVYLPFKGDLKEADTLLTALASSGNPNTYGFRVYEINDKYSSDTPVYFKVFFNAYSVQALALVRLQPMLGVQVGFEIDSIGGFTGSAIPSNPMFTNLVGQNSTVTLSAQSYSLSTKSDGFFAYFGEIGAGYLYNYNLSAGGFAIERVSNSEGVADPEHIVLYLTSATYLANSLGSATYQHLKKDGSVSIVRSHPSSLPSIGFEGSQLVARQFEASELGILNRSRNLIALRSGADWAVVEMSFDGITSRKFLLVPVLKTSANPIPNASVLGLNLRLDTRSPLDGWLGVSWDD